MNIVKSYALLMRPPGPINDQSNPFTRSDGIDLLQRIEWVGRISHRAEDAQTEESYDRFLRAVVIGKGDWSIVEHATVSVDCMVDRGITHEIVRHRLFSFTQESTRFVNYQKKMPPSFVSPFDVVVTLDADKRSNAMQIWDDCVSTVEAAYKGLLALGCAPQIARSVFPNALASRIIITGNLRNWRHFLIMRTTNETHPQARQVTIPLLAEFKEKIPILFEDIVPEESQAIAIKKAR